MIKVRVESTKQKAEAFIKEFQEIYEVSSVSRVYNNRVGTDVRVYLKVKGKKKEE